jgi:hypothetical protein
MNNVDYKTLKVGDEFFECQYGINIHCRVLSDVIVSDYYDEFSKRNRTQYKWTAENVCNQEKIDFLITEGLECYGPRLYNSPQYARFKDGDMIFEFYGQ